MAALPGSVGQTAVLDDEGPPAVLERAFDPLGGDVARPADPWAVSTSTTPEPSIALGTSVPGLAAKPVVDIGVSVPDVTAEETYLGPLIGEILARAEARGVLP